jgi:hypothetical protein
MVLLTVVTYRLLGSERAGVLIIIAGVVGIATIAAQSRRPADRAAQVTGVRPGE